MTFRFSSHKSRNPRRVIILGSTGIISVNLQKQLNKKKINFLSIGRSKIDLKNKNVSKILTKKIKDKDTVIFIAAEAPVKNIKMFFNNLKICLSVCKALEKKKIEHLIYISSDAVYADVKGKISEKSIVYPNSVHGLMHKTRESILKNKFSKILCILRPTLIYGIGDTHKGYGPNKFINLALRNKLISIFGNGEERRDHIFIEDLIKILIKCIEQKGLGILNLASGTVCSFKYLAKLVIKLSKSKSQLIKIKRQGSMPHNGYRPFDTALLKYHFKDIQMTPINVGIIKYLNNL